MGGDVALSLFRGLPEMLYVVMPFMPPEDYYALSCVNRRWRELAQANFARYLAWRREGRFFDLPGTSGMAVERTSYHLDGRECYTLTREGISMTGNAKMRLDRKLLRRATGQKQHHAPTDSSTASASAPPAPPSPTTEHLLSLQRVVFALLYDDMLVALSTEYIDVYSLCTARKMVTLRPTAAQLERGMTFTNIVSCLNEKTPSGRRRRLTCKMRPGAGGAAACVNLYDFTAPGDVQLSVFACRLKKVRSCQLSGKYLVMKGIGGGCDAASPAATTAPMPATPSTTNLSTNTSICGAHPPLLSTPASHGLLPSPLEANGSFGAGGAPSLMPLEVWGASAGGSSSVGVTSVAETTAIPAARDVDVAIAYHIATGAATENSSPLFRPDPDLPFAQKDVSLIGTDAASVAYFLQPSRDAKVLPGAWCRWSNRLLKRKAHPNGFKILHWDIAANDVQPLQLSIAGIPAPYGWPSQDPVTLTLSKEHCKLADDNSVFVCLFSRTSAACPKGLGVLCIYTKAGHLMSTLDPTVPAVRSVIAADVHDEEARGMLCSDRFRPQDYDVAMDLLAAHKSSQKLLFSVAFTHAERKVTVGKVLAKEFDATVC